MKRKVLGGEKGKKMKKMRKAKVITALALTVVMLAAMTGLAAAGEILIVTGTVLDKNNEPVEGALVIAYEDPEHKEEIGSTLSSGSPNKGAYTIIDHNSELLVGAPVYATASKPDVGSDTRSGSVEEGIVNVSFMLLKLDIPEFATIAIPVASILGLLFFFNHRKRRKE